MPRLVEVLKHGKHCALLSTTDDQLIELLIVLLAAHGTTYTVKVIHKAERDPRDVPFLKQFGVDEDDET